MRIYLQRYTFFAIWLYLLMTFLFSQQGENGMMVCCHLVCPAEMSVTVRMPSETWKDISSMEKGMT